MKIINKGKRLRIVTDLLLMVVLSVVFAVSFIPTNITAIYGGQEIKAYYNGNRDERNVSLMFNVYENADVVNKILDTLSEYSVKATFFVGGCWADDNGETLTRIVNEGHEIGNHGYFHKDHKKLSYEDNKTEISLNGKIVKALCGVEMNLFAPPSGSYSTTTLEVATQLNYKVIMWSKDTVDWRDNDESVIYKRATNGLTNGDLILMHPKSHTLNVLPKIIEYVNSVNLTLVTVSENVKDT